MCVNPIESSTALFDYEEQQEFPGLSGGRMDFQCLVGPINVCVDLKYDVLCL